MKAAKVLHQQISWNLLVVLVLAKLFQIFRMPAAIPAVCMCVYQGQGFEPLFRIVVLLKSKMLAKRIPRFLLLLHRFLARSLHIPFHL